MPSLFLGIYTALYDFQPGSDAELSLSEGDLLYLLERSDEDDWWRVKKQSTEGPDGDEPLGLVPATYIQEAQPDSAAKALYDYARQTDEEISFNEGDPLNVYHSTDPEWMLVGINGEYGFAPANYLQVEDGSRPTPAAAPARSTRASTKAVSFAAPEAEDEDRISEIGEDESGSMNDENEFMPADILPHMPPRPSIAQTSRPARSQSFEDSAYSHPSYQPATTRPVSSPVPASSAIPADFHTFPVQEVDSKRKKHRATLGISNGSIILAPESSHKEVRQWSIKDTITHSTERKHVFLDLRNPVASLDLHAGTTDTANEIGGMLNEMVGSFQAKGLKEVLQAAIQGGGGGDKIGGVLYDFDAAGDDEVSVKVGEDVIIVDDSKSDEWWMVRRADGKQGVVPSSYIEFKHFAKKTVPRQEDKPSKPPRESTNNTSGAYDTSKQDTPKSKPDSSKVRIWTDRSGTFKVEAAFIGCKDGKIHLHKVNGIKIAVPAVKMSVDDVEYVEQATGQSLHQDENMAEIRKKLGERRDAAAPQAPPKDRNNTSRPDYDWFEFFLGCGVDVNSCQRYALNFQKDQMDGSILEDINPSVLRTLGLKEGDILRVMRTLDVKFNRKRHGSGADEEDRLEISSGLDGNLRNNRRDRPSPADRVPDVINSEALSRLQGRTSSPSSNATKMSKQGFEDDAWATRPSRATNSSSEKLPRPSGQQMSGSLVDLSTIKSLSPTPTAQSLTAQPSVQVAPERSGLTYQAPPNPQSSTFQQPGQQVAQSTSPALQQNHTGQGFMAPQRPLSAPQNYAQTPQTQYQQRQQMLQPMMTGYNYLSTPAPPGQSLHELNLRMQQQRMQQQMQQMQMQQQMTGYPQSQPQMTGYPMMAQNTGYQNGVANQFPNGLNSSSFRAASLSSLQPPLLPQQTSLQPPKPLTVHRTGPANFGAPVPQQQMTQSPSIARPLQPQVTGPPPPVRFGLSPPPLQRTATGSRRANLAQASECFCRDKTNIPAPENPFGF